MKKLLTILLVLICSAVYAQNIYIYPNEDTLVSGEQWPVLMFHQSWQGDHGLLYLPKGYDSAQSKRYPLICFYHGAGGNGGISNMLGDPGIAQLISQGIVPYSSTTPGDTTWFIVWSVSETTMGFGDTYSDISKDYRYMIDTYKLKIDTTHVYATGLSSGGDVSLRAAGLDSNEFAAVVPMSTVWSNMSTDQRGKLDSSYIHILQVHGYNDATATFSMTHDAIANYNTSNPTHKALLWTFNGGHCCWNTYYTPTTRWTSNNSNDIGTYTGTSIYTWMLTHTKSAEATPPPNQSPTANAGIDQTLSSGTTSATLTGSGTDADGNIASYQWSTSSGATITSPTSASTTVTGLADGNSYTFTLTVTDDGGATDQDEVVIYVNDPLNLVLWRVKYIDGYIYVLYFDTNSGRYYSIKLK